jgi:outer membrane receptor protein involved in Fe transport
MKTKALLFIFSLCSIGTLLAQKPGAGKRPHNISGSVFDYSNSPVPYASIALYTADSLLLKGTTSDESGSYALRAPEGSYFIKVSFLSFEDYTSPLFDISRGRPVNLDPITLTQNASMLEAVDITEEKSHMELQLDKRVFNVGKDLSNAGGNAAEILANVPSVDVDIEGNVSLRGSENVRVLIDGRPSGMTSGSADALRMLQGNLIDKIEVITNPSSRFDAEGEVGIINIILKKEKKQGLNGAFELKAGYPTNAGASFSLNYRKKWVNLFASSGVSYRSSPGSGSAFNQFESPDTSYHFESTRQQRRGGLSNMSRVGADFFLNDNNTLTTALIVRYSDANNTADIDYNDLDSMGEIFFNTLREESENEIGLDLEANVNYKKTFKRKGHEWVSNVSINQNDDTEESSLTQTETFGNSTTETFQRSSNTEDQRRYEIKTDYVHPFGKDAKIEVGAKASLREIQNNYSVELKDTGDWYALSDFTNQLVYNENIYAGYVMHSNKIGSFSYQGGLRAEQSDIKTLLKATNESNPRSYFNLFPSAHLSYELNPKNALQASYSRRISRPRFRELIPFFSYTDPRNFYSGNPDLNPEYTDSYELGYLQKFEKGSLLSSLYYRHTTGPTERITVTDSTGLLRRFPVNLSTMDAYGVEFNLQYEFYKWLRTSISANIYQASTQGSYNGRRLSSDAFTASSRAMVMVKLPKAFNLQASGRYRAPRVSTQGKTLAMYTVDMGLSKDVLKGNGTITASAKDVFNGRKRRWIVDTEYLYSESEFQWQARQFLLIFTYRLNQKKSSNRGRGGDMEGSDFEI